MFPIKDDNPSLFPPLVTYGLIALNVAMWFLVQGAGAPDPLIASVCRFGLVPAELLGRVPAGTAVDLGPGVPACRLDGVGWPNVLTSMFMHGGWMHIIGNMWFLWIFGNNVEDSMGRFRFVLFYLVCGLAAGALQVVFDPGSQVPMVGASGAIGGVMGAYVVLYPRVRVHLLVIFGFYITTIAVPAVFMLGYWFLIQLLGGTASLGSSGGGVAFWAHVGGFVAGALLVFPFRREDLVQKHPYHGWSRPSPGGWRRSRW